MRDVTAEKNRVLYRNNKNMMKRSVEHLSAELIRALRVRRQEAGAVCWRSTGKHRSIKTVEASEGWKIPGKLFEKTATACYIGEFVVDILMDASGSQRDRQGQVALQAYIISEALKHAIRCRTGL